MSAAERHRSTVIAWLSFDLSHTACSAGFGRHRGCAPWPPSGPGGPTSPVLRPVGHAATGSGHAASVGRRGGSDSRFTSAAPLGRLHNLLRIVPRVLRDVSASASRFCKSGFLSDVELEQAISS